MEILQQSFVFVLFIVVGVFLQRKLSGRAELKGVKLIILNVALPATIFIALVSVEMSQQYIMLPVGALILNGILMGLTYLSGPVFGIERNSGDHRTMMLLIPSMAPGLSCFPFLSEFLGEDALALGALADVGNKFFVLICCYLIALHWSRKIQENTEIEHGKLKSLVIGMINEPINLVMIIALFMVLSGWNLSSLPSFMQQGISRASLMMTPLVLLFIGLSVRLKWAELKTVLSFLVWRSGVAFLLSGLLLLVLPGLSETMSLLIIIFPQSAVSFWPFAHMTALEKSSNEQVFNSGMAISVLACSLPFSTLLMLGVFSSKAVFLENMWLPVALGVLLITLMLLPRFVRLVIQSKKQILPSENYNYAD